MITLDFKKRHVAFVIRLISQDVNYLQLFFRMKSAILAHATAGPEDAINVQCNEDELVTLVRKLSGLRAGLAARINKEMKDAILPIIGGGCATEGSDMEAVLDGDGNPVMIRVSLEANAALIASTRPKMWHRIAIALQTSDANDEAEEAQWVADGMKIATAE